MVFGLEPLDISVRVMFFTLDEIILVSIKEISSPKTDCPKYVYFYVLQLGVVEKQNYKLELSRSNAFWLFKFYLGQR